MSRNSGKEALINLDLLGLSSTGELSADINRMELPSGQDSFVMALADFISDPSLSTPLTVGLYSRWGTGKSVILSRIQEQIKAYCFQEAVVLFRVSAGVIWTAVSITITAGLIAWAVATWVEGLLVALATFVILIALYISARSASRRQRGNFNRCGLRLHQIFERMILFFKLLFCVPPSIESVRALLPVHFIIVDMSKSSIFGDNPLTSLVNLAQELNDAVERDLGMFIPRLYRVFRSGPYRTRNISRMNMRSRWKTSCCCIPSVLFSVVVVLALWTGLFCLAVFEKNTSKAVLGVEIASACIVGIAVLCNIPRFFVIIYCLVLSMKKRITIVSSQPGIRDETFMHVLKQEIDLHADMLECIDGFTGRQTRVVLFVDLLESLEQQKVLHFVNAINSLLSEAGHPFISLISVDPRLVLKAIDQNLAALQDAHISPYDYFKNTVDLPCYFAEQKRPMSGTVLPRQVISTLGDVRTNEDNELQANAALEWVDGAMEEDDHGHHNNHDDDNPNCNGRVPLIETHMLTDRRASQESLNYTDDHNDRSQLDSTQDDDKDNVANDLSQFLRDNDSGSLADIKRIMNIISLTGRLLHARSIPFRWRTLASWVSLADAWPYKVAWLIIIAEDSTVNLSADITLKDIYNVTGSYMSILGDQDMALDADIVYFETYLSGNHPTLTVGDVRRFLPCTFHIDPWIRRSMVEYLQALKTGTVSKLQLTGSLTEATQHITSPTSSRFMWRSIAEDPVLSQLTSDEVIKQMYDIDGINSENVAMYQLQLKDHNINGKVLAACDMNELRDAMQMAFGDWQLFKTWILTARSREQSVSPRINMGELSFQCHSQAESTVEGSRTDSNSETPNSPGTSRAMTRGASSGSEQASVTLLQEFEDGMAAHFSLRGSSKGPYGSHALRQVLPHAPHTQGKQQKQESIDSVKSIKSHKDLSPIIEPVLCSNCDSFNYNNNTRHLQRSADSGFASTEVDANQIKFKPLTRQTSVQEGKEYEAEMAEAGSSKASSKSELSYREFFETGTILKGKSYRDDGAQTRDVIPEIKVQKMNSLHDETGHGSMQECNTVKTIDLSTDQGVLMQQPQSEHRRQNIEHSQRGSKPMPHHHTNANNELIQSIRKDLSSASSVSSSSYHNNANVNLRQPSVPHQTSAGSKSKQQRVSVDSLSEIPLPPIAMLVERPASKVLSPSPPLPAPPADLLTDSEEIISPPPAYQKVAKDVFFTTDETARGIQETSFGGGLSEDASGHSMRQAPKDIQSLNQVTSKQKIRKPQIGAISRIPAVTSTLSPVKQGMIKTNPDYQSPRKQTVSATNATIDQAMINSAKSMTASSTNRRDARGQQTVKYKKINEHQ
eukprot:gene7197-8003_t